MFLSLCWGGDHRLDFGGMCSDSNYGQFAVAVARDARVVACPRSPYAKRESVYDFSDHDFPIATSCAEVDVPRGVS